MRLTRSVTVVAQMVLVASPELLRAAPIPHEWVDFGSVVGRVLQAIGAFLAHSYNTDGTPQAQPGPAQG